MAEKGVDDSNKYGFKKRHGFLNLYRATLPLATIFLLDILPSRVSLIIVGHLTLSPVAFTSIFLAYCFTNFFSVFVLSLSCGLDTLSKRQLENVTYYRYALALVTLGLLPYIICIIFSESILTSLHQPVEIIATTSQCIRYLSLYAVSYIVFAMLRKSLLQYLHTQLLIGLMFARLCLHLVLGYALFEYTDLEFLAFVLSDSLSMAVLVLVTLLTLSRTHVDLAKFAANLCCGSAGRGSGAAGDIESKRLMAAGGAVSGLQSEVEDVEDGEMSYLREYVSAMLVPGAISCLEWWAVEAFSFLVGALTYAEGVSRLTVFCVHASWASLLLIFEMPMLGLSVAMAAIITADIRAGNFYPAWYTFLQSMASVVAYCVAIGLAVILGSAQMMGMFFPMDADAMGARFVSLAEAETASIAVLFTLCVCGYAVAMSFLGIFVSVGRLARGGTFMLVGYYAFGLILAVVLGFVAEWRFYGVWFGFAGSFLVWALLSAAYWSCTDWFHEMGTMKQEYDKLGAAVAHVKRYGATDRNAHKRQML